MVVRSDARISWQLEPTPTRIETRLDPADTSGSPPVGQSLAGLTGIALGAERLFRSGRRLTIAAQDNILPHNSLATEFGLWLVESVCATARHNAWSLLVPICAALLAAQQTPDIRVDVDLVTVACAVDTRGGIPAGNLKAGDFRLLDNGQPREIRNFWQESDLPLTVALVADVSGSQAGYIRSHREAIAQFLAQVVGPRDRAMVVEVAQKSWLISGLTGSGGDLSRAVESIGTLEGRQSPLLGPACRNSSFPHTCGGTALWHGLYYTAKELKDVAGRKAIIVLSDGLDTGSDIRLNDLIEMAQSAGTVVYSIKYASRMRFMSIGGAIAQAVSRGLDRLSRETGGLIFPNPGRKTSDVFSRIESDLRNMYVLSFTPPAGAWDGTFHKLQVTTPGQDLVVRSRTGYWARRKK
jgi:VWFA-related protein